MWETLIKPPFRRIFEKGKVFEITPIGGTPDINELKVNSSEFFLPFDNVTILMDGGFWNIQNLESNQIGMDVIRKVVAYLPFMYFKYEIYKYNTTSKLARILFDELVDNIRIKWSRRFRDPKNLKKLRVCIQTYVKNDLIYPLKIGSNILPGHKILVIGGDHIPIIFSDNQQLMYRMATVPFIQLHRLHNPINKKFLVNVITSKSSTNKNQDVNNKYIYLNPGEFQRLSSQNMPSHNDGGGEFSGFRRAHWRTFHSDYFVNVQGESRYINSIWLIEKEKTIGDKQYRVILD